MHGTTYHNRGSGECSKKKRKRKSNLSNNIPLEVIKLLQENGMASFTDVFIAVWNTAIIPNDLVRSTFFPTPKRVNTKESRDHKTMSYEPWTAIFYQHNSWMRP